MTSGWEELEAAAAEARGLVAAKAPDAETAAEGQAYVARVVAAGLSGALLGHHLRSAGLSRALPVYGGPNPDYILLHAQVDPAERYRLEGRLNGSERVAAGLYAPNPGGPPRLTGYAAFGPAECDDEGRFALELAAGAEGSGALALTSSSRILLVRVLHRNDGPPADVRLTGGAAAVAPALPPGEPDAALRRVASAVRDAVHAYLPWTAAARSLANTLAPAPAELTEAVQGDPDTVYLLGGFDLEADEWLEVTAPGGDGYWSLHAYSYWFEHLQTPGAHDRNAAPDAAGGVLIAVGPRRPEGVPNWIDTAGRRRGALIFRMIGGHGRPSARLRKRED